MAASGFAAAATATAAGVAVATAVAVAAAAVTDSAARGLVVVAFRDATGACFFVGAGAGDVVEPAPTVGCRGVGCRTSEDAGLGTGAVGYG